MVAERKVPEAGVPVMLGLSLSFWVAPACRWILVVAVPIWRPVPVRSVEVGAAVRLTFSVPLAAVLPLFLTVRNTTFFPVGEIGPPAEAARAWRPTTDGA